MLKLWRKPTRRERLVRSLRRAQRRAPARLRSVNAPPDWLPEYQKTLREYEKWLRRSSPVWVSELPLRQWRIYARDTSGDTSRLSFVTGLLLGFCVGVIVTLAMTARPRRPQDEEFLEVEAVELSLAGELEEEESEEQDSVEDLDEESARAASTVSTNS